jgi:hypothetical protein
MLYHLPCEVRVERRAACATRCSGVFHLAAA